MHYTKRFYLIFSLVFALSIPLVTFTYTTNTPPVEPEIIEHAQKTPEIIAYQAPLEEPSTNYLLVFLWTVYGIGVFIFGYRFLKNLNHLSVRIKNNEQLEEPSHINVLLGDTVVPYTFLKYIFVSKKEYQLKSIPEEVLLHEKTHVVQKHTLDILFIEVLQVVFWFNPLLILIKKSIKLNHEFLADQTVLKRQFSLHTYMNMLVNYPNNSNQVELSSPINYSLTKKRIVMMSQQFSKTRAAARMLLLLPILLGCMLLFNNQIIAQQKNINYTKTIQDTHPDKKIKIKVTGEQIMVNGSATKLSGFAKTIDDKTKQWKDSELTEFQFDIKIQNSDDSFVNKLNDEYRKTRLYSANPDGHDLIPEEPPLPPRISKIKVNAPASPKSVKIKKNVVVPPAPPSPPSPSVEPDEDIDIDEIEEEVLLKREEQVRIEEAHEYEIESAMRIAEQAREAAESARMIAMEESHRAFERLHQEREIAEHARARAMEAAHRARDRSHRARDKARQHAEMSRLEAEKVREMAMREAQRIRKEIVIDRDKLREEARAAAENALLHAEKVRKEVIQEAQKVRKQARKIADEARKEARKEMEKARKESEKERRKSRRERNRL